MTRTAPVQTNGIRTARWPWVMAMVAGLAGTVLSFAIWHVRLGTEAHLLQEEFEVEASALGRNVEQEIALFMNVLDSIRHLHSISENITRENFEEFVDKGMWYQRRTLAAFGFAQRIEHQMRTQFEGASPQFGISIQEPDGDAGFKIAGKRAMYLPLTYQAPADGLGVPIGFDFSVRAEDEQAVQRMSRSGQVAVAGREMGSSANATDTGYYIFSPILYPMFQGVPVRPPGYLEGFTIAILRPGQILQNVADGLLPRSLQLCLRPPMGSAYYRSLKHTRKRKRRARLKAENFTPVLTHETTIPVGDQDWTFQCIAGASYVRTRQTQQATIVLVAGLLITTLLTALLLFMAGRTRSIERVVFSRTTDLRDANMRIQEEMDERMRLQEEILEIGSREKKRVGRDLHDSLGQKLTGAAFLSRSLTRRLAVSPEEDHDHEEDRKHAEQVNQILKESVTQVRRIARGLAPVELDDEGLVAALRRLAKETQKTYGVPCTFEATDETAPTGKTAVHLYQIVQEALNNAMRHGKPESVRIALNQDGEEGWLEIKDDGSGLPTDARSKGGMGLKIMRYRASMIGGEVEVMSPSDGGTLVTCSFRAVENGV